MILKNCDSNTFYWNNEKNPLSFLQTKCDARQKRKKGVRKGRRKKEGRKKWRGRKIRRKKSLGGRKKGRAVMEGERKERKEEDCLGSNSDL